MADTQSDIKDWSITASSNLPSDATTVGANIADNFQTIQSVVRTAFAHKGADIASAGSMDLGAVPGFLHDITGSTGPITSFGTVSAGVWKILQFDSTPTITYNATSMILPGNADITAAAGDHCMALSLGSGNWIIPWYVKDAAGAAPPFSDAVGIVRGSSDATKILRLEVDGLTTATTRVLTVQDEDGTIALTSEFAYSNVAGSSGRQALPRMWISGLTFSRDTDTDHDTAIAAGEARDDTNAQNMILSAVLTKRIDAAWAVGDDQGGLDGSESVGGTPDADTWYFIWLIKRSDTGVVDALYSESSSSPTLPTNYDYQRLIGAVRTDGSANILAYSAMETSGGGLDCLWSDPPLDVNEATPGTSANLRTLSVPTGIKVMARVNAYFVNSGAAHGLYLSSPDVTDEAASVSGAAGPLATIALNAGTGLNPTVMATVRTNTSSQIRARQTVNTQQSIATLGWEWSRR